jgi:hypothetical protein
MISNTHQHLIVPASRHFARSAGYALVLAVAVFLLIAIFTNPVLP